ncbi:hypothetical protein HXA34_18260 [Salipaludibacillus agaradhaerens]|uniref:GNAT family N-acetyltransferase n=1 Tax=Salipaludibacillus agaradhaerens TaxID=76935 RepID=UPI0021506D57|nr:hypothetical protein [Salipaludibacillus agaradhaerens]MCR6108243.1 hypothetical protein [Salipaludibacillus agaradhaerens]MCR6120268.1 hypothetical protein [Salipaludibacillus agaradhaerens]UJW59284.1 hypothetical protein HXZ66_18660 [Bacillus sp. A116_S68]
MTFIIREAREEDVLKIQHFISKAGVSLETVPNGWEPYILAEDTMESIVATAALQVIPTNAYLIRSLVVDSEQVSGSFLIKMLETTIQYAREKGAQCVYFIVKQGGDMMESLGFTLLSKEDIPKELKQLNEVKDYLKKGYPVYCLQEVGDK